MPVPVPVPVSVTATVPATATATVTATVPATAIVLGARDRARASDRVRTRARSWACDCNGPGPAHSARKNADVASMRKWSLPGCDSSTFLLLAEAVASRGRRNGGFPCGKPALSLYSRGEHLADASPAELTALPCLHRRAHRRSRASTPPMPRCRSACMCPGEPVSGSACSELPSARDVIKPRSRRAIRPQEPGRDPIQGPGVRHVIPPRNAQNPRPAVQVGGSQRQSGPSADQR